MYTSCMSKWNVTSRHIIKALQKDGWWYYLDKEGYIKAAFWNDSDEALEHESKRLWFIKYLIEKRDEENALVISFVRDHDILDLDIYLVD